MKWASGVPPALHILYSMPPSSITPDSTHQLISGNCKTWNECVRYGRHMLRPNAPTYTTPLKYVLFWLRKSKPFWVCSRTVGKLWDTQVHVNKLECREKVDLFQ